MTKPIFLIRYLLFLNILWLPISSQAVEIRYNGFGDISYGIPFGGLASQSDRDNFLANGEGEKFTKGEISGFVLGGLDSILTVDLNDKLIFQSEINLQVGRGVSDEIELDVERSYINYIISPQFNIMAGLYFTPIGYINRNLYARAWMMNSTRVRDAAEEELGFLPTHSTGINFHGSIPIKRDHALLYALNISNGRGSEPTSAVYARNPDSGNEYSLLLEYSNLNFENLRVGISGWTDKFSSPGYTSNKVSIGPQKIIFQEKGYITYLAIDTQKWGSIVEFAKSESKVKDGTLSKSKYDFSTFTAEIFLNIMGGKLHPYIRYDETQLPDNGDSDSYWNIRSGANYYIPEFQAWFVGAAYDLSDFNRIKVEYTNNMDGPRRNHNLSVQSAFAF